jgi:acyl dehydratase
MTRIVYWEDVKEGDILPTYSFEITTTLIVDQVSGSQDYNLMHHDTAFARRQGAPDAYLNTGYIEALLSRSLTDFMGDAGFLKKLKHQMRRFNALGDTLKVSGKVTAKRIEGGENLVECDVWLENNRDGISVPGTALVRLPSRVG